MASQREYCAICCVMNRAQVGPFTPLQLQVVKVFRSSRLVINVSTPVHSTFNLPKILVPFLMNKKVFYFPFISGDDKKNWKEVYEDDEK